MGDLGVTHTVKQTNMHIFWLREKRRSSKSNKRIYSMTPFFLSELEYLSYQL